MTAGTVLADRFNSQPPEGGWLCRRTTLQGEMWFQLTAARRRLANLNLTVIKLNKVSTHSRPKAAGHKIPLVLHFSRRFNSQPPEGGWTWEKIVAACEAVSTHSRPKAAGAV